MSRLENVLEERFSSPESKKVKQLASMSSQGELSTAATLFRARAPSPDEVAAMKSLLERFTDQNSHLTQDAHLLVTLSLEAKAINHQAALLHGERILKAQNILKKYQEGAFSFWLMQTYGNRQTPYNFLLYYELFQACEKRIQQKLEEMPKAAAYSLAARGASIDEKCAVIEEHYKADRKTLLEEIQRRFPLSKGDKRAKRWGNYFIRQCASLMVDYKQHGQTLEPEEMKKLKTLIKEFQQLLNSA